MSNLNRLSSIVYFLMRLFLELSKRSFQRHLTYRAATIAGLATNLFFGLLRAAVLVALYNERESLAGLSVDGAVTYTGITQAAAAYLSIFGWWHLMMSVESGQISSDLLKPMPYYAFWLAQDLGRAAVQLFLRGCPIILFYALIFDITYPTSLWQWLAFALAIIFSWIVSFSFNFLVNLAAFWTPNARGIGRFAFGFAWTLSGFFLPLRFFPDWFVNIANLTPFPSMVNTTVEIYLGVLTGPAMIQALLIQIFWGLVLIGLGQWVLQAGVRRLVIQGG